MSALFLPLPFWHVIISITELISLAVIFLDDADTPVCRMVTSVARALERLFRNR